MYRVRCSLGYTIRSDTGFLFTHDTLLRLEDHSDRYCLRVCAEIRWFIVLFFDRETHQQSDKTQDAQRFISIDDDRWFGNWWVGKKVLYHVDLYVYVLAIATLINAHWKRAVVASDITSSLATVFAEFQVGTCKSAKRYAHFKLILTLECDSIPSIQH